MAKNSIKAVVWDLDGTLIDFKIDFIRARKESFIILKKYGISDENLSLKNSIIDTFKKAREIFISDGLSEDEINKIIQEVDEKVISIEREAALNASMISGIDEVLEFIKNKRLKQAIYTFNNSNNAKISLETVNLLQYFDVIAGRDTIDNPKPHPDHLKYICNKLGVEPFEIVVIGDHARDIEGALNLGSHSIAIHSRLSNRETLKSADIIIEEREIPLKLVKAIEDLL